MSDTKAPPYIEVDKWVGGVPLFIMSEGQGDDFISDLREHGCWTSMNPGEDLQQFFPQVFYIVAEEHVVTKTKTTTNTEITHSSYKPAVFRVVSNLVGNAIHRVDDETVGLGDIEQQCFFTLPPIPYELINDIDDFFREVYRRHGTEAIVMFTFEPEYLETDNPSDGWGILVPDQTNTAGSCDYEPESVIDEMPDDKDVRLVGTAHSHPGMAAYCSGTDKRDQSSFDGIHITYGWKRGSKETEYYIELQMGGGQFVMDLKDVFTDVPPEVENEKAVEWAKKVKKGTVGGGKARGGGKALGAGVVTDDDLYAHGGNWWSDPDKYKNLPENCPKPDEVTLVAAPLLSRDDMKNCPVCDGELSKREKETAKCLRCSTFLQWVEMTSIHDIIKTRKQAGMPAHELDVDKDPPPWKSIWIWEETTDDKGKIIDQIYEYYQGRSATQGAAYQTGFTGGNSSKK